MEFCNKDELVARITSSISHPLPVETMEAMDVRAFAKDRDGGIGAIDGTKSDQPEVLRLVNLYLMSKNESELSYWVALVF